MKLMPNLASVLDLQVGLPDLFDPANQSLVALRTRRPQLRVITTLGMQPVSRRGDLHHLADRLDRGSLRCVLGPVLEDHPHGPLHHFRGAPR